MNRKDVMSDKISDPAPSPADAAPAPDPDNKNAPKNLDEWSARVLKNMTRMASDEEYRREITKRLS